VSWHPYANYQILLHFLVCADAVMVVLALSSIRHRVETHYAVDNRSNPARRFIVGL
jgi:hypothetical protein